MKGMRGMKRHFWAEVWRTARIIRRHGYNVAAEESLLCLWPWRPGDEPIVAINWMAVGVAKNMLRIRELCS